VRRFNLPNTLIEMVFDPASQVDAMGRFNVELVSVIGGDYKASFSRLSRPSWINTRSRMSPRRSKSRGVISDAEVAQLARDVQAVDCSSST
jgi:hypothetical protein